MKRWSILSDLTKKMKPKVGAEVGVQKGYMTRNVLRIIPSIETYYAIDPWLWYPEYKESVNEKNQKNWNQKVMNFYYDEFLRQTKPWVNKIKILRYMSDEAAKHIPDESLDFCFIDGNHDYEYVKQDIKNYMPKVKKGGLFGGHDYGHVKGGVKEAVKETVDGFFLKDNLTWWVWVR